MDHIEASVAPPRLITLQFGNFIFILSGSFSEIQSPLNKESLTELFL